MSGLADLIPALTAAQRESVRVIEGEMDAAGFPREITAAAIVNAYAESRLNPRAQSKPPEDSAGLFQLNIRGAGAGMPLADRLDPVKNTRRIIEIARKTKALWSAYDAGERQVPHLAATWSTHVERPADKIGQEAKRAVLALRLFPAGIGATGTAVARVERGMERRASTVPRWILVGGIVTVAGSVLGLILLGVRRRALAQKAPRWHPTSLGDSP